MPRRTDLQSILILGSEPIVIGQAAEYGYRRRAVHGGRSGGCDGGDTGELAIRP